MAGRASRVPAWRCYLNLGHAFPHMIPSHPETKCHIRARAQPCPTCFTSLRIRTSIPRERPSIPDSCQQALARLGHADVCPGICLRQQVVQTLLSA